MSSASEGPLGNSRCTSGGIKEAFSGPSSPAGSPSAGGRKAAVTPGWRIQWPRRVQGDLQVKLGQKGIAPERGSPDVRTASRRGKHEKSSRRQEERSREGVGTGDRGRQDVAPPEIPVDPHRQTVSMLFGAWCTPQGSPRGRGQQL